MARRVGARRVALRARGGAIGLDVRSVSVMEKPFQPPKNRENVA